MADTNAELAAKLREAGEKKASDDVHVALEGIRTLEHHVWANLPQIIAALEATEGKAEAWKPSDGDKRCQECGRRNPGWYADNDLWNRTMGGPEATSDPGGVLCPTCFLLRSDQRVYFHISAENPDGSPYRSAS